MFGCHFQTATDMLGDEFLSVLTVDAVDALVASVVKQEVVADA